MKDSAVLLIDCSDQKGLVARGRALSTSGYRKRLVRTRSMTSSPRPFRIALIM